MANGDILLSKLQDISAFFSTWNNTVDVAFQAPTTGLLGQYPGLFPNTFMTPSVDVVCQICEEGGVRPSPDLVQMPYWQSPHRLVTPERERCNMPYKDIARLPKLSRTFGDVDRHE